MRRTRDEHGNGMHLEQGSFVNTKEANITIFLTISSKPMTYSLSLSLLLLVYGSVSASPAGTARWVAETARWGTLTAPPTKVVSPRNTAEEGASVQQNTWKDLSASIVPIAASKEHNGRIFFYLTHRNTMDGTALTISQASFQPELFDIAGCGDMQNVVDAQDPRCAKLTFVGRIAPCDDDCEVIAKQALFAAHPSMENYPADHDFHTHEMIIDFAWMIANFGGGDEITAEEYYQATPSPHEIREGEHVKPVSKSLGTKIPDWNNTIVRARWITYHSRWGTVSTSKHRNHEGDYFGNIRSITDGPYCESSTGRPIFQFPDADPTAKDLSNNNSMALTLSEASIAARVASDTGAPCGGKDAGSPLCAQLVLYGKAVPINPLSMKFRHALAWFQSTHPLAPWLNEGGSHMSGTYYTMDVEKIMILDYFGGYKEVRVGDYLQYDMTENTGEYCQGYSAEYDRGRIGIQERADHPLKVFMAGFIFLVVTFLLAFLRDGCGRKEKQSYHAVVETTPIA